MFTLPTIRAALRTVTLAAFCAIIGAGACLGANAPAATGQKLAFVRFESADAPARICVLDMASGKVATLTSSNNNSLMPTWSPDGTKIAFASDRAGSMDIFVMNADGSGQTALTKGPDDDVEPCWSQDGRRIFFCRLTKTGDTPSGAQLYTVNSDGSGETLLSQDVNTREAQPSYWEPTIMTSAQTPAETQAQGTTVRITTNKGDILIELFDKDVPITTGNFLLLAESGYYKGVTFHRVIPGFMVQGGDPAGTGAGGPGFTIPDECKPNLKHDRGMLSMAKLPEPHTGGSQFFICTGGRDAVGHLDMLHSVFGKVIEGMDIVDSIRAGDKMLEVKVDHRSGYADAAEKAALAARVPQK